MCKNFDMTPDSIREYWKSHAEPPEISMARWNKSAEGYSKMELPTEEDSMAMATMAREGIFEMGGNCLDVGCGAGRFSFALERKGFDLVGTDFSPAMIEACESKKRELNSNAVFSQDNWHTVDLDKKGWRKNFDFVLCHMSPAICDADSFMKLTEAAKKAVLMLRPCRWVYDAERELMHKLKIKPHVNEVDKAMAYAFDLLWTMGYCPKTEYENHQWHWEMSLEEAVEHYTKKLSACRELNKDEMALIKSYFESRADEDGKVSGETKTQIISMFWRVDEINYYEL